MKKQKKSERSKDTPEKTIPERFDRSEEEMLEKEMKRPKEDAGNLQDTAPPPGEFEKIIKEMEARGITPRIMREMAHGDRKHRGKQIFKESKTALIWVMAVVVVAASVIGVLARG